MPYTVKTEGPGVHRVYDQSGVKVAESPTREAAEASAKVLTDAEKSKEPDDAGTA